MYLPQDSGFFPTDHDIGHLLDLLEKDTILVTGRTKVCNVMAQDPTDHIFLSRALEAGADFIASGDRHLLILKVFEGILILSVVGLLERLAESKMP